MSQLKELAKPFPDQLIKKAPSGKYGTYVGHSAVTERLLQICGGFDFELVEVIRGHAPEFSTKKGVFPSRENAVVGVVARLSIEIDGKRRVVEEVGTEDNPAGGNDGDNLKNAMSDALKRCAMRLGCGLHLWSRDDYYLYARLHHDERKAAEAAAASAAAAALTVGEAGDEPAAENTPDPGRSEPADAEPASGSQTVTPAAGRVKVAGGAASGHGAASEFPPDPPAGVLDPTVLQNDRARAALNWASQQLMEIGRGAGKKAVFQNTKKARAFYEQAREEFLAYLGDLDDVVDPETGELAAESETDFGKYFARKVRAAAKGEEYVLPPAEGAAA